VIISYPNHNFCPRPLPIYIFPLQRLDACYDPAALLAVAQDIALASGCLTPNIALASGCRATAALYLLALTILPATIATDGAAHQPGKSRWAIQSLPPVQFLPPLHSARFFFLRFNDHFDFQTMAPRS
jgi:hypothetical protein